MEVMSNAEFEQKDVLIGQHGKTQSFGVSDDASLMSMLSTGLYAKPHRTMIQEIIFNAWDAHRMGGIQQTTPIDIYINDTSGLIVRDYGPGIHPDQMVPIYCIYGNSTKRDDSGSTGGFGLGSKSPFAYTESFTVSSYHEGKHNMYLISRASDANDGKPGLTPLVQNIDTEESGLRVIVPLNEGDEQQTYIYLLDLLQFSGIWANIHYLDKDVQEVKAKKLEPREMYFDHREGEGNYSKLALITANYGGVSYAIEDHPEYTNDYRNLAQLAKTLNARLRNGFPADSLTPLPNREGLNMSPKAVETIKTMFEYLTDTIDQCIKPAFKSCLHKALDNAAATGLKPDVFMVNVEQMRNSLGSYGGRTWSSFIAIAYPEWHSSILTTERKTEIQNELRQLAINTKPENLAEFTWVAICSAMWEKTEKMIPFIGGKQVLQREAIKYAVKLYPQYRKHLFYNKNGKASFDRILNYLQEQWMIETMQAYRTVAQVTGKVPDMRLEKGVNSYEKVYGVRRMGSTSYSSTRGTRTYSWQETDAIRKMQKKLHQFKLPTTPQYNRIFRGKGEEVTIATARIRLRGVVVLAQRVSDLDEFTIDSLTVQPYYSDGKSGSSYTCVIISHVVRTHGNFPIFIVNTKKYEAVRDQLKAEGWDIIEVPRIVAEKPVKRVIEDSKEVEYVESKPSYPTFPLFTGGSTGWIDESAAEVRNPDTYLAVTYAQVAGMGYAERNLVQGVLNRSGKNLAILHNKRRIATAEKAGAIPFQLLLESTVDDFMAQKDYLTKLRVHWEMRRACYGVPEYLRNFPEFHKLCGIPFLRSEEREQCLKDMVFLESVSSQSWNRWHSPEFLPDATRNKVDEEFFKLTCNIPKLERIQENLKFLDEYKLNHKWDRIKNEGEKKMLAQKVLRFLRTV